MWKRVTTCHFPARIGANVIMIERIVVGGLIAVFIYSMALFVVEISHHYDLTDVAWVAGGISALAATALTMKWSDR